MPAPWCARRSARLGTVSIVEASRDLAISAICYVVGLLMGDSRTGASMRRALSVAYGWIRYRASTLEPRIIWTLSCLAWVLLVVLGRLQVADQVVQRLGATTDRQTSDQEVEHVTDSGRAQEAARPASVGR